jgi:predicted nucleotidyltransferase
VVHTYLERVLGSGTKVNALAVLVSNSTKPFLEVELAKEAGASVSEVNRQMVDLVNSGLVTLERIGKGKVYRINRKHFLFKPLESLFQDLETVYRRVAREIVNYATKSFKIQVAILFGSLSRGGIRSDIVTEPSDIDIAIVADSKNVASLKNALISYVNSEISYRYGISVYPVVLSREEYTSALKQGSFVSDIHAKGEVLYGEKPRRFG